MENLSTGIITSIIGLGIVGLVLGLLSFLVGFLKMNNKPETAKTSSAQVQNNNIVEEKENIEAVAAYDETELVAAIVAAIAAGLNTSTDKLIVRSFRKISTGSSWNEAAKRGN